jgi:SAM-dependent methyltransferase
LRYDRDFWNSHTAKAVNWELEQRLLAAAVERFELGGPDSTALDFACGTGRVLGFLESRVSRAVGVDISDDMVALAAARYPTIVKLWRSHWAQFVPFLAFPPEVRRVVYTTNLIESMNARLRKVTRNRGQFPTEQAALKVLYLAVRNLDEYRGRTVGIRSSGWKQALQAFTIYFEGRIPTP